MPVSMQNAGEGRPHPADRKGTKAAITYSFVKSHLHYPSFHAFYIGLLSFGSVRSCRGTGILPLRMAILLSSII